DRRPAAALQRIRNSAEAEAEALAAPRATLAAALRATLVVAALPAVSIPMPAARATLGRLSVHPPRLPAPACRACLPRALSTGLFAEGNNVRRRGSTRANSSRALIELCADDRWRPCDCSRPGEPARGRAAGGRFSNVNPVQAARLG